MKEIKENMKPAAAKIWKAVSLLIVSAYLTFLADAYVLNSTAQRLLAFGCFAAICVFLAYIKKRFMKGDGLSRGAIAFSAILAILLLTAFYRTLLPLPQERPVCLEAVALDDGGSWGEVWLTEVTVNGEVVPISDLSVKENIGWQYCEEYDDYAFYPSPGQKNNRLTLRFHGETISLRFGYNAWSGKVRITDPLGKDEVCNLYNNQTDPGIFFYDCSIPQISPISLAVYTLGCCYVLFLGICWLISLAGFFNSRKGYRRYALGCFMAGVFLILFFTTDRIAPDGLTILTLGVLTAAAYMTMCTEKARSLLKRYETRGQRLAVGLIALYASTASFGQRFFLDGNTRMHFSEKGFFYLLLGVVWFIPIIYFMLFGLERLCLFPERWRRRKDVISRRQAYVLLLGGLCVGQTVILLAFWPGGYPSDCISQFSQAIGVGRMSDWFPVLHTLLYRGILTLIPNLAALPAVQMFFFALLCTEFLMIGYDHGIPFEVLACLGIVFILLPNQALSGICPVRDYPYMLALLWGGLLLLRLSTDLDRLKKPLFSAALSLDLFFIFGFRHNGIAPFLVLILFFLVVTVRRFPKVQLRLVEVSVVSVLLVLLYKGPLFSALDVSTGSNMSPYTTMLCAVGSCVNKDLPLSEKTNAILESALPLEDWGTYYSRFEGHDQYYWGRGEQARAYRPNKISGKQAFSIYFEALFKYPDVVLKDRLDGTDILWNVREAQGSFNFCAYDSVVRADRYVPYTSLEHLETTDGWSYYNRSALAEVYRKTMELPRNNVLDMLLWRTGAYLILLMVLALFWWGNRMKGLLWASIPLLGNIAGLVLVLYHQSFRYVYAVQVIVIALVFCTICLRNPKRRAVPEGKSDVSGGRYLKFVFRTFRKEASQSDTDTQASVGSEEQDG